MIQNYEKLTEIKMMKEKAKIDERHFQERNEWEKQMGENMMKKDERIK